MCGTLLAMPGTIFAVPIGEGQCQGEKKNPAGAGRGGIIPVLFFLINSGYINTSSVCDYESHCAQ